MTFATATQDGARPATRKASRASTPLWQALFQTFSVAAHPNWNLLVQA
ncbi:hypothetical protein [Paractinoplanes maris]|nr:hypothetical protein [Actinoplanes maris]